MPPIYHRVWYWLRINVQHEPFLFPTRERYGLWVLPGQKVTSLQQIAEGVKWVEWGREVVPNKKTIKGVLDWLVCREMVTVESNGKGTFITLVNWHIYNDYRRVKVTAESNSQGTRYGHKLEGKEGKEKEKDSSSFDLFWKAYPRKVSKAAAEKAWSKITPDEKLLREILEALQWQKEQEDWQKEQGKFIPHPATWLNGKRWTDERPSSSSVAKNEPPQYFNHPAYRELQHEVPPAA